MSQTPFSANKTTAASVIGKLFSMGTAFWQHKNFVKTVASVAEHERYALLKEYVNGWSDMSFVGFTLTLSLLLQHEKNVQVQNAIRFLSSNLDKLRSPAETHELESVKQPYKSSSSSNSRRSDVDSTLQEDVDFINHLVLKELKKEHVNILVDRIITFDESRYTHFLKNLQVMQEATSTAFENHRKNELNFAAGPDFDDKIHYFSASERTGEKDPDFIRVSTEYEVSLETISWAINVSPRIWQELHASKN